MARSLMIDVGAGTMDLLWTDDRENTQYKAVVLSPVQELAHRIAATTGDLFVTGREMGGGPVSRALAERAKTAKVTITAAAAATIHHDRERVEAQSIEIIDGHQTPPIRPARVNLADVDYGRIRPIVEGFGVEFAFDVIGVCVQDHGVPPAGVSHLTFRHDLFRKRLDEHPHPHALLYAADQVPDVFNRLRSAAADARTLCRSAEVYVMDSGMAAILGATLDDACRPARYRIVLDVATSHTVAAAFDRDELCGFFEYHTRDVTVDRLDVLIRDLADGNLDHERIVREGGHGAYLRKTVGFDHVEIIVATGPRRDLVRASTHPLRWGAPLGDNMMTGTAGLLEAVRRRKGLPSLLLPAQAAGT